MVTRKLYGVENIVSSTMQMLEFFFLFFTSFTSEICKQVADRWQTGVRKP